MSVLLSFPVANIEDVLKLYTRIKVFRAPSDANGDADTANQVELTTTATEIILVSGQTEYDFIDQQGTTTDHYANAFYNPVTNQQSELSPFVLGVGDGGGLNVINVEELKEGYLFGVDLTDDSGCPFPDTLFERHINNAIGWVERQLDIKLNDCQINDERHDFYRQDYYKYIRLQTHEYPIISVQSIRLVLPTDQQVIDFDSSWWQVQRFSGQIEIIPGRGQLSVITLGQTGAWLPLIYGWTDFIPDVFRISYRAGFEKGKVPPELVDLVGKVAATAILHIAGDLVVGAGVAAQSVSVDGISTSLSTTQSATNSGYGARILAYRREIKDQVKELRRYYKGVRFVAV